MNELISIKPSSDNIGERIDTFISDRCEITRSAAQKLITDGNVNVNEKAVKKNYRIGSDDLLEITLPEPELLDVVPQNIPIEIVYEDPHLMVVNKPKGMVVHPAHGNESGTLVALPDSSLCA